MKRILSRDCSIIDRLPAHYRFATISPNAGSRVDFTRRRGDDDRCCGCETTEVVAMNKWILAAILTAAALFMYVSIFVKMGAN